MTIGSLFSGYGGLDIAASALGFGATSWHCEFDKSASAVLSARWPGVPNLGSILDVDWASVPQVDVITGGFPCQDISNAGKREGINGARSGLWGSMATAIGVLRPRYVFVENVAVLKRRGLDRVLGDLAEIGYDARWDCLRASDVGAPHRRERLFLVAENSDFATGDQRRITAPGEAESRGPWSDTGRRGGASAADHHGLGCESLGGQQHLGHDTDGCCGSDTAWGDYEPAIRRWEEVLGRCAPSPTEESRSGGRRLSSRFMEWMMGLPDGWVTSVDVSPSSQKKILGNGVVPQQAMAALGSLI